MKKLMVALLMAGFLACVCSSLSAEDGKKKGDGEKKPFDPEKVFKRLDKDGDGALTLEEFKGKREGEAAEKAEKAFKAKDKDGDGKLTLEEFKARPQGQKGKKPGEGAKKKKKAE